MNNTERNFYNDIKSAVSNWNCSFSNYHDDSYSGRYFCVDVTVEDEDADWEEVWNTLENVANDWGGGIDSSMNVFYLAIQMDV